jgi:hypothetical protein
MTLLYRSPNVAIDAAEWHVSVQESRCGKRAVVYRWRHERNESWHSVTEWVGRLPKGLGRFFQPYRRSIDVAMNGQQFSCTRQFMIGGRVELERIPAP